MNIPKNIVIVGGGTAGWLTALYIKHIWKNSDVQLIESSKIGILGAGEGSTTHFPAFIKDLGIDENEFMYRTKSTYKIGIDFGNWRGDDYVYQHNFIHTWTINSLSNQFDLDYYTKSKQAYGYHFDARLVAEFFKEKALERGIKWIDALSTGVKQNDDGDVEYVLFEDGSELKTDFVFDCTGFARNIIGKVFNSEWESYEEWLKVNAAIPFFLPRNSKEMNTSTESNAMDYGWMWKIPLQHRWGCGYIFDENKISVEDAKKEVEKLLGHTIESPKTFRFKPGAFKDVWIKNCLAVGLSSGFLEPLEATSIMTAITQLLLFKEYFENGKINEYNKRIKAVNDENMNFIYYHYICDKNDTDFWKEYARRTNHPEMLMKIVNSEMDFTILDERILRSILPNCIFVTHNWYTINFGARNRRKNIL